MSKKQIADTQSQEKSWELAESIIDKWKKQGQCVLFIDGNTNNCEVNNLQWTTHLFGLKNLGRKVDWDSMLTKRERQFVIEEIDNFITILTIREWPE